MFFCFNSSLLKKRTTKSYGKLLDQEPWQNNESKKSRSTARKTVIVISRSIQFVIKYRHRLLTTPRPTISIIGFWYREITYLFYVNFHTQFFLIFFQPHLGIRTKDLCSGLIETFIFFKFEVIQFFGRTIEFGEVPGHFLNYLTNVMRVVLTRAPWLLSSVIPWILFDSVITYSWKQ